MRSRINCATRSPRFTAQREKHTCICNIDRMNVWTLQQCTPRLPVVVLGATARMPHLCLPPWPLGRQVSTACGSASAGEYQKTPHLVPKNPLFWRKMYQKTPPAKKKVPKNPPKMYQKTPQGGFWVHFGGVFGVWWGGGGGWYIFGGFLVHSGGFFGTFRGGLHWYIGTFFGGFGTITGVLWCN